MTPKDQTKDTPKDVKSPPTVRITANGFSPDKLTVKVGETIMFLNDDKKPRNVTFDEAAVISMDLKPGDRFTHTVTAPGEHAYHEKDHPETKGSVTAE